MTSEKAIEEYINYAKDGIDALSSEWPEEAKKDVAAIKKMLDQALAALEKPAETGSDIEKAIGWLERAIEILDTMDSMEDDPIEICCNTEALKGIIPEALALLKPAVCEICKGSGEVLRTTWQVGEPREHRFDPCPRCKPAPTGQALRLDSTSSPQVCSGQPETGEWQKGNQPKESHWYLVKYLSNDKPPVVCYEKLWFNPDSIEKWWFQHERFSWQDNIIAFIPFAQFVARINRLEAELKQQYDKVFLEGTEAQEDANRKHIIEPLQEEKKRLKEELDKHHWIPVSEGLPKNIADVWIVLEAEALNTSASGIGFYGEDENGYGWEIYGEGLLTKVTHWKPIILPEQALQGQKGK